MVLAGLAMLVEGLLTPTSVDRRSPTWLAANGMDQARRPSVVFRQGRSPLPSPGNREGIVIWNATVLSKVWDCIT